MRTAVGVVLVASLAACSVHDADGNSSSHTSTSWSPDAPQALVLAVVTTPLKNGLRIEGRTNLPDETALMLSAQRGPVLAGTKVAVYDGRFYPDLYPRKGEPIPNGAYDVEVSTPLADLQPDAVKSVLGRDYSAVAGPLVVTSQFGGRIIDYNAKANIGGTADPAADKAARQRAYKEFEANSRRGCEELPRNVESVTGQAMTAAERAASIQRCLQGIPKSRNELIDEGLIEP
jgi:hypothetical protein